MEKNYNLLFPNNQCVICGSDCVNFEEFIVKYECKNRCCYYEMHETYYGDIEIDRHSYYIFDKNYYLATDNNIEEEIVLDNIRKAIKYWKENDRYLMKIIEGT